MIVTKENGTIYTNGLTLNVIDWHKEYGMTIAFVTRPLTTNGDEYVDDITPEEVAEGQKVAGEFLKKKLSLSKLKDYLPIDQWRAAASVGPLQMRKALRQMGLMQQVKDFLATQDEETQEEWEYATVIERNYPMIETVRVGFGMTEEQVDDLFTLAGSL